MKISGVYKITNAITGDFYIGSSKDVKHRWSCHKCQSRWNEHPNCPMYLDMKKYGVDKFAFEILEEAEVEQLKEKEQEFIEKLQPTYNQMNANGLNIERRKEYKKEYQKEYQKTDKYKEWQKEYNKSEKHKESQKKYEKTDKRKQYKKEYEKTDKRKKYKEEYNKQLCFYNGETITLHALSTRFWKQGIKHPTLEAKKYLLNK